MKPFFWYFKILWGILFCNKYIGKGHCYSHDNNYNNQYTLQPALALPTQFYKAEFLRLGVPRQTIVMMMGHTFFL